MSIFRGGNEVTDLQVGGTPVQEVYQGGNLIWTRGNQYTLTAGESGAQTGYADGTFIGPYGTLAPDNAYGAYAIRYIYTDGTILRVGMEGSSPPQNLFDSITIPGIGTFNTVDATFSQDLGLGDWRWNVATKMVNTQAYNISISPAVASQALVRDWVPHRINFTAGVSGITSGVAEPPFATVGTFNSGNQSYVSNDGITHNVFRMTLNDPANELRLDAEILGGGIPDGDMFTYLWVPHIGGPLLWSDATIVTDTGGNTKSWTWFGITAPPFVNGETYDFYLYIPQV